MLSCVEVAFITAVPYATACTTPLESTVATFGLLLVHVMSFIVALLGAIVGVNCTSEPPGLMVNVLLFNVIPVTRCITVTVDVAAKPPSVVVAVTVAVPAPTGVSIPVALTFATVSSLLFH